MKYISQISKEYGIHANTLRSRMNQLGITAKKDGKHSFLNHSQILLITGEQQRQYKNLVNSVSTDLILAYSLTNPYFNEQEVAYALSIDLERVQIAFKQEYLTLPSKMNRD